MNSSAPPPVLADLRAEIDRIDETMHRLLMERGEIIDRLVAVKRSQSEGSAFRPAREAAMMRRLVDRHAGLLPLDTVESIWRVIISTFTYVQAPYAVHADLSVGEPQMRDSARFHFGFTTPFVTHMGPRGVIESVVASKGDLGLLPASALSGGDAWWTALEGDHAPKIIARLPFVERADHPAGLPVFVVSHPINDAAVTEVETWSLHLSGWNARAAGALGGQGDMLVAADRVPGQAAVLLSVPAGTRDAALDALRQAGAQVGSVAPVGSHAAPYRLGADGTRRS
ncbi:MAG: chorismate mutase [Pseudomonadota bacterium]